MKLDLIIFCYISFYHIIILYRTALYHIALCFNHARLESIRLYCTKSYHIKSNWIILRYSIYIYMYIYIYVYILYI